MHLLNRLRVSAIPLDGLFANRIAGWSQAFCRGVQRILGGWTIVVGAGTEDAERHVGQRVRNASHQLGRNGIGGAKVWTKLVKRNVLFERRAGAIREDPCAP